MSPGAGGEEGGGARRAARLALAFLVAALTVTPITNNDLFLHLTTGSIVLTTGHVPRVDDYSALARGRPFVAHEWLAGALFRLVQMAGGAHGFDLLILFKSALAIALSFALLRAAAWSGAREAVSLAGLGFVMILAAARLQERPQIFSHLLLASVLLLLARRRALRLQGREDAALLLLVPLQVLWANLHGSFLLAPAVVLLDAAAHAVEGLLPGAAGPAGPPGGGAAAARPARREARAEAGRLSLLAAGLVGVSLVNPYGWRLLLFPFQLTGSAFMKVVYEWEPPFASSFRSTYMARYYVVWAALCVGLLAGAAAAARRRGPPPCGLFPAFVFAFFFALSLRMNRNVTDFAIATLPGAAALGSWLVAADGRGPLRRLLRAGPVAALLLALAGFFTIRGYAYSPSSRRFPGLGLGESLPVRAVDYVERNRIEGACFNTYSAGAYLVYRLYPRVRVGMDSRNDVYGEALYGDYARALGSAAALGGMLRRLDASFILLEWPQQGLVKTAAAVNDLGGWRPVYFDDQTVVYLEETGRYAEIAARDGYRRLDPALFRPGVWSPEEAAEALREIDRAAPSTRAAYITRVMRVEALAAVGRRDEARDEEGRIMAEDPPLYHVPILLGLMHLARGEKPEAAARLRRALELNPASDVARAALLQAER